LTVESLLRAFRERWYVLVLGLLLTAVGAAFAVRPAPLYWTQADVLVLAPGQTPQDNPAYFGIEGLTIVAGMVEREVNGGPVMRLADPSAPIYGAGVRDGFSVTLPNAGGQWTASFTRPVLSVEVVAPDPDVVAARYDAIVERVIAAGDRLQDAEDVPLSVRVRLYPVTQDPPVVYVGPTASEKLRGLAAVLLVGVFVSGSAAALLGGAGLPGGSGRRTRASRTGASAVNSAGSAALSVSHRVTST
jgi:hypothetical protein